MTSDKRAITELEAPLRLVGSHEIAQPGFQSGRRGEFFNMNVPREGRSAEIVLQDITILGVKLAKFTLEPSKEGRRLLRLEFERPIARDDALSFLQQFADAWSATLAERQRDPWYGNLYLDIQWSRVKTSTGERGLIIGELLEVSSTDGVAVDPVRLAALRWSPLLDVFVEGMKASQPKSKFLFWFVILEELEKRDEFAGLFTPLFSDVEKAGLQAVVRSNATALQRLNNGLLNNPMATLEGRAAKLTRIVDAIGSATIEGLEGSISVDQACCTALIKQRNNVAHKGSKIDENLLYRVLFPLSRFALNYILDAEAKSSSDSQVQQGSP